jgi:hypothetical protein
VAGFALGASLRRIDERLLRRFSAGMAIMLVAVGVVYMDSNSRLCVDYLVDDQRGAGVGLVTLGALLAGAAFWLSRRPHCGPQSRATTRR